MCLKIEKDAVRRIAQEDIRCIKILREDDIGRLYSPYQWCIYELDELMTSKLAEPEDAESHDHTGDEVVVSEYWVIEEGLHSYQTLSGIMHYTSHGNTYAVNGMYYFNAIIPKGSEYYQGEFNGLVSYASNQLIVQERLFYVDSNPPVVVD